MAGEPIKLAVHRHRCAQLLQHAPAHHRDAVGQHHGLFLVVGDEDGRHSKLALQPADLGARLHPQRGVQIGKRLVHQKHRRVAHHGAAHRHALTLPARQFGRPAVQQGAKVQHGGGAGHLTLDVAPAHSLRAQAERHVLAHAHVRVERIVLEHHRHVALMRLQPGHVTPAEHDAPARRPLQPGDASQRRALAAAGRAEQGEELAMRDMEVQRMHRRHRPIRLAHPFQRHACHAQPFTAPDSIPVTSARWNTSATATGGTMASTLAANSGP